MPGFIPRPLAGIRAVFFSCIESGQVPVGLPALCLMFMAGILAFVYFLLFMRHLNSAFSGGQDKRPKGASFETALCASHAPGFWAGIRIRSIRRICECRPQGASKKIGRKRPCASHAPCFWPAFCLGFWPACWPVFFFTVNDCMNADWV